MTQTTRLRPDQRKRLIVAAALALTKKHGLDGWTRRQVAEAAGISVEALKYHFKSIDNVRRAVAAEPGCPEHDRNMAVTMGLLAPHLGSTNQ